MNETDTHFLGKLLRSTGLGNSGELARSHDIPGAKQEDGSFLVGQNLYRIKGEFLKDFVLEHFLTPKPCRWGGTVPFPKRKVYDVSCGGRHMLVAAASDTNAPPCLYAVGLNSEGQLGLGDTRERYVLTKVDGLNNVTHVAAGGYHSLVVTEAGTTLYACGRTEDGALGIGFSPKKFIDTFQPVAFPKVVVLANVFAGDIHSMALTTEDEMYSWGSAMSKAQGHFQDATGQEDGDIMRPVQLPGKYVAAQGSSHGSVFLRYKTA